jgi:hypothetical protein
MCVVRRFLRFAGNERPDRIGENTVRAFFQSLPEASRKQFATVIRQFLVFAAARCDVGSPKSQRLIAGNPAPKGKDAGELALRKTWDVDRVAEKKEQTDDLIVKLARKVIDCYLHLQGRMKGEPENLDDVYRLADECRELIESNLARFMQLSAEGRNVHSKIDWRMQR